VIRKHLFKENKNLKHAIQAKFCRLIASLSVVLPQLNLTKLKLEYTQTKNVCVIRVRL